MEITNIPFNKLVDIGRSARADRLLEIADGVQYTNHLGTVHAAALFALAEASSGEFLQRAFKHLTLSVVPLVRSASTKYRKPARGIISSNANFTDSTVEKITTDLTNIGRTQFTIAVDLYDESATKVAYFEFVWFVTKKLIQ